MNRLLLRELVSAGAAIAGGLGFAVASLKYGLGSMMDMAPGMFPFLIGLLIAATGVMILVAALTDPTMRGAVEHSSPSTSAVVDRVRAFVTVVAGLTVFGFLIRPFGLAPAVIALTLVVGQAEHERKPVQSLVIAAALAALATFIFIVGLGMNIRIFNWGL